MRKMIIMRGPQGVGKSALCAKLGLGNNKLASDEIRLMLGAPELNAKGEWGISQERGDSVFYLFDKLAKERLDRGETLALDAMFIHHSDLIKYEAMASERGYETLVVDFSDFPLARSIEQDARRDPIRVVGQEVILSTRELFASRPLKAGDAGSARIEKWSMADGDEGLLRRVQSWLTVATVDLSSYEQVVHIGDLQGCWSVLAGAGAPLEKGFDPKSYYIFCGDLLDRGLENGQVLRWFVDQAMDKPNVALVWGNHEDHLWRWGRGEVAVAREFLQRTQPQLVASGLEPKDALALLGKARDILPYVWHGQNVVVTHAGLPGLPPLGESGAPLWHLLSRHQLSKGAGGYSDPIDQAFSKSQAGAGLGAWTQVHGHRNKGVGTLQYPRSVNLEDGVEFGGNLRMATLSAEGWAAEEHPNKVFASWRQRFSGKTVQEAAAKVGKEKGKIMDQNPQAESDKGDEPFSLDVKAPIPDWIVEEGSAEPKLSAQTIKAMRDHEGVMEKPMPDRPHISSLNFTRDVFFDKAWDDVVVKARGLFYNTETGEVASRGYEKFFNIGERPETELASLAKTLSFPVVGYLKENGYLGNLGYDSVRDELMCASKSTTGGDFAAWFKEIFESKIDAGTREEIKRYMRDAEACFVFEVVDPVRDPHMIEYPEAKLTLLDVFHRSEDGRKLPYEQLKKVGKSFGLEVKRRMFDFKSMEAMTGWMNRAYKDLSYRYDGQDIEGVVFEDAAGYQTKCKVPHYGFWKSMRSGKDRLARLGAKREEIREQISKNPKMADSKAQELENVERNWKRALESDNHPMALSFMKWASEKPGSQLVGKSIIELRSQFDTEVGIKPEWLQTHWDRFDPTEKEEPKPAKSKPKM